MESPAPAPDYPLFHLRPPYTGCPAPIRSSRLHPGELRLGSVIALPVAPFAGDWRLLAEAVRALRERLPAAPVVLRSACGPAADVTDLALRAGRLHVRALLVGDRDAADALRAALTTREYLAEDVGEWLAMRGFSPSPTVAHIVRQVFSLAPRHTRIHDLLDRIGEPESSVRARFRKKGLPPPHRWLQAARALHAGLEIQGNPGEPLLRIAVEGGHCDAAALSKLVHGVFGIRPSTLRGTLGWEWLMDRWTNREGMAPTPRGGWTERRKSPGPYMGRAAPSG